MPKGTFPKTHSGRVRVRGLQGWARHGAEVSGRSCGKKTFVATSASPTRTADLDYAALDNMIRITDIYNFIHCSSSPFDHPDHLSSYTAVDWPPAVRGDQNVDSQDEVARWCDK